MSDGRKMVDPVGWDEKAQRVHDVTPTPTGLLHHSRCWCRHPPGRDGDLARELVGVDPGAHCALCGEPMWKANATHPASHVRSTHREDHVPVERIDRPAAMGFLGYENHRRQPDCRPDDHNVTNDQCPQCYAVPTPKGNPRHYSFRPTVAEEWSRTATDLANESLAATCYQPGLSREPDSASDSVSAGDVRGGGERRAGGGSTRCICNWPFTDGLCPVHRSTTSRCPQCGHEL